MTTVTLNKTNFALGTIHARLLDQYLGGEELQEPIMEKGNVFSNDFPYMTPRADVFDEYQ
jgi:hypothetical protein